jgi:hypothetical protein
MTDASKRFVEQLVAAFDVLKAPLAEHKRDNFGQLFPHLFIADVARFAVRTAREMRAHPDQQERGGTLLKELLQFLESSERADASNRKTAMRIPLIHQQ